MSVVRRGVAGLTWEVFNRLRDGPPTLIFRGVVLWWLAVFAGLTALAPLTPTWPQRAASMLGATAAGALAWACVRRPVRLDLRWVNPAVLLLVVSQVLRAVTTHPDLNEPTTRLALAVVAVNAVASSLLWLATLGRVATVSRLKFAVRAESLALMAFAVFKLTVGLFSAAPGLVRTTAMGNSLGMFVMAAVLWDIWKFFNPQSLSVVDASAAVIATAADVR